ncbi:hypothetical protein VPH35_003379 [Triticum aestivum]
MIRCAVRASEYRVHQLLPAPAGSVRQLWGGALCGKVRGTCGKNVAPAQVSSEQWSMASVNNCSSTSVERSRNHPCACVRILVRNCRVLHASLIFLPPVRRKILYCKNTFEKLEYFHHFSYKFIEVSGPKLFEKQDLDEILLIWVV